MATIAFFDLFNYPLTAREVWQSAFGLAAGYDETLQELDALVSEKRLAQAQAFYFLPGREELVTIRHERYNITSEKFKYALRAARLFRWLPWIKLITVGNLIGGHNLRRESDIDLLIVTAKGRLWASRLLVTTITKFLGWRPQAGNNQDKICLSFWASEEGLDFSGFRLPGGDPYFRYWLAGLYPIYDNDSVYDKLIAANSWLAQELPRWSPKATVRWRRVGGRIGLLAAAVFDRLFGWSEKLARKIQLRLMSPELKRLANQDTRVVVNDCVLKFHANDRREEYRRRLAEKLQGIS
ncbi:hypothetical protein HGA34_05235 [Candidatus Falkowbacteria bacterium]|nr:hypothetical protein [Candidatus Falkowbacteria bacterium]